MNSFIGFYTLASKESKRVLRIWRQTLIPTIMITLLYFVIFGKIMGARIGNIGSVSYIAFVAPGLVMMNIIMSSYQNTASSLFLAKFTKSVEELLVSTLSPHSIIWGYLAGSIIRCFLTGFIVILVSLFFANIQIYSWTVIIISFLLTSIVFGLAGIINAIFAKSFDGVSVAPNLVLTPMIYLGGVFFSIKFLPPIWHTVSHFNPIFYIINDLRFGFLGFSDVSYIYGFSILAVLGLVLYIWCYRLISRGVKLKS